ncbi:MAG: polymer-forming cytoskeletal protein [Candidatus Marinimicrobia bacterium]|nr:polymer-forming cytoskeletal protein [Candidatus Neomarinimicrobiota bacterium]
MKLFYKLILVVLTLVTFSFAKDEVVINEKFDDYFLEAGDTLKANVHLKMFVGDVNIAGVVNGNITVYGGEIFLDSTSVINGNIKNIGGKIIKTESAIVDGDIVEAIIKGNHVKVPEFNWNQSKLNYHFGDDSHINVSHTFREVDPFSRFKPGIDFNRQEGLYLQIGDMINEVGNIEMLDVGFKGGYSFGMKEWEAEAIVRYNFFEKNKLSLYTNLYHQTEHFDKWRTNDLDNIISYLFKKEDNYDRIFSEGYKIGVQQRFRKCLKFKFEYISQAEDTIGLYKNDTTNEYRPIAKNIDGLSFTSGKLNGFRISNSINIGKSGMTFPGEMLLSGIYENYGYGSDWNFDRLHLELDYITTIEETIQNRTRVITSMVTGEPNVDHPVQYEYWLGGIGSLRGIPFKSLQGNKMFLMNQEIGIGFNDIWFFGFVDAGIVDSDINNSISEDLLDYDSDDLKSTVGFGIETGDLYEWGVRFDIAKETSTGDAPWIGYFRMSRMF